MLKNVTPAQLNQTLQNFEGYLTKQQVNEAKFAIKNLGSPIVQNKLKNISDKDVNKIKAEINHNPSLKNKVQRDPLTSKVFNKI
jgi:Tfp pilus assembly major pilin PilA